MRFIAIFAVFITLVSNVNATTMTYEGVVTYLSGNTTTSSLYGLLEEGDLIEGSFSYDSSASIDTNDWDAVGNYRFNDSNSYVDIRIYDVSEGSALLYEYSGYLTKIHTSDNWEYKPAPTRYPVIDAFSPKGILDTGSEIYLRYQNRDTDLDYITSDDLPETPLDFEYFNYATGSLTLPSDIGQVDFDITGLVEVPLPPLCALFAIGIIALPLGRRRSAKK